MAQERRMVDVDKLLAYLSLPVAEQQGDVPVEPLVQLEEARELSVPALSVNVDFNDLLDRHDEVEAYRIVTALKDLLA